MKLDYINNKFCLDNKEITSATNETISLPFFYNIHCHLGENIYKDIDGDDWTIVKYLEHTFKVRDSVSKEKFQELTDNSFVEVIQQLKDNKIKGVCASRSAIVANRLKLNNMAGYPIMKVEGRNNYLDDCIHQYNEYYKEHRNENCLVGISIHSLYTNTDKELKLAKECMDINCDFITIHISEDEETRRKEIELYGTKPIETLERFGLLSDKTIVVHCGHLDEDDLALIKKYNATIALCPISNIFLNTKIINIIRLNELGINWCVTTDGLATGRTFSMEEQALLLKEVYPDITYEELYKRTSFVPKQFFTKLDSYNTSFDISISYSDSEDLFKKILKKEYECK